MTHQCGHLLIHCIDFRLQKGIGEYLRDHDLLGDCDVISIAGACKDMLSKDEKARYLLEQIDISHRLHTIKTIILMNHTDCGAYGGRSAFGSEEEETKRHQEDMAAAERALKAKYPEIKITKILVRIGEDGQLVFEGTGFQ